MLDSSWQIPKAWAALPALMLITLAASGCGGSEVEAQAQVAEMQQAAREEALAERETGLAAREAALAEQGLELATRLEGVTERSSALDARAEELGARGSSLAAREAALARRASALAESEARLATDRQALTETRAVVDREAARQAAAARRHPPAVFTEIDLEARTRLDVEFLTTVSSASSRVGDTFVTRLVGDLHAADGRVVVPAGTELSGVVTEAVPVKRVGGQALLGLRFGEFQLPWGKTVEVNATFADAGRDESRRDKKIIGGGAAAGAVLGAIIDDEGGALVGAILGAAAGTAAAANRPGDQVEIPGGTIVTLELEERVAVTVPWKSRHAAP